MKGFRIVCGCWMCLTGLSRLFRRRTGPRSISDRRWCILKGVLDHLPAMFPGCLPRDAGAGVHEKSQSSWDLSDNDQPQDGEYKAVASVACTIGESQKSFDLRIDYYYSTFPIVATKMGTGRPESAQSRISIVQMRTHHIDELIKLLAFNPFLSSSLMISPT